MNEELRLALYDEQLKLFGKLVLSWENAAFYATYRAVEPKPVEAKPAPLYRIELRH
jgi:hypothetical protein